MAAPLLPTQFPCWVKATYSWGGENKGDLGFMEGDLIECLNAGDGSWWMGRLRRDRRMVGLFPSNFVKLMGDDFIPGSRNVTPRPSRRDSVGSGSATPTSTKSGPNTPSPQKNKSLFRKPFTAYAGAASPNPQAAARGVNGSPKNSPSPQPSVSRGYKTKPFSSMKIPQDTPTPPATTPVRIPSPTIPAPIARASLTPRGSARPSRNTSPAQPEIPYAQPPEPAPEENDSPPPPPPPAHRIAYTRPSSPELDLRPPEVEHAYHRGLRTPSPAPSEHAGNTPSPLRDAMNDVMSSLDDMGLATRSPSPDRPKPPSHAWAPEAFSEVYANPTSRAPRPHTSMGLGHDTSEPGEQEDASMDDKFAFTYTQDTPQRMNTYKRRMENRLRHLQKEDDMHQYFAQDHASSPPPEPPPKNSPFGTKPSNAETRSRPGSSSGYDTSMQRGLRNQKSAYELGRENLRRMPTTKSSVTESSAAQSESTAYSNSTQLTSQSLMSGYSAGGFSATSAGSLARRKFGRLGSIKARPQSMMEIRPVTPGSGPSEVSYHSSHSSHAENDSRPSVARQGSENSVGSSSGPLGGLSTPVAKKRGFFKKMLDSAKTSAATARSNISTGQTSRPSSRHGNMIPNGVTAIAGGMSLDSPKGPGGSVDWMQMRRDTNRSNSLSHNERSDRRERCQMNDIPVIHPVDVLNETAEGDESGDGYAISDPTDFNVINFALVDKSARFVVNLPALTNPISLAQGFLCRQYRSDSQKLRAIFTWVAEKIGWEEDFEGLVDTRRVIQTRRGCSEEIAVVVTEMCNAVGIPAETIRGHLKTPRETMLTHELQEMASQANHWWNAVLVDGEWRIIDCSLASPSNPNRSLYSSAGSQVADTWWFLARPMEICYTHVPLVPEQQHIVPPIPSDILMALPVTSPAFFKNSMRMWAFDTSLMFIEGLEVAQMQMMVPEEVECTAEVEAHSFGRDSDGDLFESGDVVKKRALAQAEFVSVSGTLFKRYTIKGLLPSERNLSSQATLKVYAGRRGLMHSITKNPHSLAISIPLNHEGTNPEYDFFTRHPTPHASRHEIYVVSPQCRRLALNSTFVFGVRQHPASSSSQERPASPNPYARSNSALSVGRPGSAMSMASTSASGSNYSNPSAAGSDSSNGSNPSKEKPAKLAVQSPSGKIIRMTRKPENRGGLGTEEGVEKVGTAWETFIKIGEKGVWRGLVLADRSARWCVFGEWECV